MASIEIIEVSESYGSDFYVYVNGKHVRTCPSYSMAADVAANAGKWA